MLVEGKIPVGQVCPYRGACPSARDGTCHHRGVDHTVAFSCGTARMFKIFGRPVDTYSGGFVDVTHMSDEQVRRMGHE